MIDGRAEFMCVQSRAGGRAGTVRVIVDTSVAQSPRVCIGGTCITTARGTFASLPAD